MNSDMYNNKIIEDAVSLLNDNGVIIVPTDTLYGLACSYKSEEGKNKIYDIKKRNVDKKLPIIVNSIEMITNMFEVNELDLKKLKMFFPGKLTLILKLKNSEETLAVRMINNEIINKIIEQLKCPLYLTSANISGEEPKNNVFDLLDEFEGKVDMVIVGNCNNKQCSTIVELKGNKLTLVREGALSFKLIEDAFYME